MKPPLEHSHSLPQAPAIVNERHRRIMALLHQQTSLSVSQLAHMLGVSEVTIRKDLTLLDISSRCFTAYTVRRSWPNP